MADIARRLPRNHPLAGCEEKLWRAEAHFKVLDEEISRFTSREAGPASIRTELKPNIEHVFRWFVHQVEQPPLFLATVIGDFVHNLRSSLDHLVFELSFLGTNGRVPGTANGFPCCRTRDGRNGWNSSRVQSEKLAGVLKEHRAMIYRTQPCYRLKDAPTHPRARRHQLADLENFWNHDKHRMLQPVVVAPHEVWGTITGFRDCVEAGKLWLNPAILRRPVKPETEIYTLPIRPTGPHPHVDMSIKFVGDIGFSNGLPALKALADIRDWVWAVIEWFVPEFETPKARGLWDAPRGGWIERTPIRMTRPRFVTWTGTHDRPPQAP